MRLRTLPAAAALLAAGLAIAIAVAANGAAPRPAASQPGAAGAAAASPPRSIDAVRAHLAQVPGDWPAWSSLGALELERGRATGDPAAYAAAQQAYGTSLRLQREGNDAALAGAAALSAARHEFATAQRQAQQALAINPESPEALAALTDALTELGRYGPALATARRLDAVRPGLASFARLSYQAELRGQIPQAIDLMGRAAGEATTPAQVAFTRTHEGLLALGRHDLAAAQDAYRAGVAVAPTDTALIFLGARIAWATGDPELAVRRYADLVARRPSPVYAGAQAEALHATGDRREEAAALDLVRASQRLAVTAGVAPEGADVLFEADHGDPGRAIVLGARVWKRSPSVGAADAYGWALHVAGRDRQALTYADQALSLGGKPALVLAHRGMIRAALGMRAGARADLTAALHEDPTFSALLAPRAQALLDRLERS